VLLVVWGVVAVGWRVVAGGVGLGGGVVWCWIRRGVWVCQRRPGLGLWLLWQVGGSQVDVVCRLGWAERGGCCKLLFCRWAVFLLGLCISIGGCCSKIAEAEAVVSVSKKKRLVMHVHGVNAARRALGPPKPLAHCDMKVPVQLLPFCWA
jgi:hypothetical protein